MNQKEEKRQRELIKAFDEELFTYTGQVAWALPGLFSFLALCLIAVPAQDIIEEGFGFWYGFLIFSLWIPHTVLLPYLDTTDSFTKSRRKSTTYSKLQYLPVSRKQYNRVRLEYLFRYLIKLTGIGFTLQCVMAFLVCGGIGWMNVAYPLLMLLGLPLLFGWLDITTNK